MSVQSKGKLQYANKHIAVWKNYNFPTLALSKSGNGLKRYSLLSACLHKHPLSQLQSVYHLDMGKSI